MRTQTLWAWLALAVMGAGFGRGLFAAETGAAGEAEFLAHIRQLTFEGKRSGEGYFSPDGKALIFQSEREAENPFYQIHILDLESGDVSRVSPGVGKTTCGFFRPGSDEVLFASTHLDPQAKEKQKAELDFRASGKTKRYSWDYDEQMDIFSAHRDGSGLRRLTDAPGYDAEGSYSPDGRQIVFSSLRNAYPVEKLSAEEKKRMEADPAYFAEIYIMNADGSGQRRLTELPGYDGGPFFSPDGRRIIWRHFNESGTVADLFTMKPDGTDSRQLTDFGCMSWAPYFHPSGDYAIFTCNKQGFANFELYLVDAAVEREPVRATFTDGFDGLPVFSPDGKKLAWTSNRGSDGKSQIYLADWNDAAARKALEQAPARKAGEKPAAKAVATGQALSPEITAADCRQHVTYLASDLLEGRMTGSSGIQKAADYIVRQLQAAHLQPLPGASNFFQEFSFNAGENVLTNQNSLLLVDNFSIVDNFSSVDGLASVNNLSIVESAGSAFVVEKDFRPLAFTANQTVEGEVVFAGYGLSVPGKAGEGYDSYAGLDVTNKIVVVLRYVPEEVPAARRQELNRYAGLRYKAMLARERGAKAILVVAGPNSPNAGELIPLSSDGSLSGSGIAAASISSHVAAALLATAGKDLKTLQAGLDSENPHAEPGFVVPKVKVKLSVALEHLQKKDNNILAYLPPAAPRAGAPEYILVGAHYDHLGYGGSGSMEAKEQGQIHNGADDNASGVAAVLELGAALATEAASGKPLNRGVIFAFWSGEELGLLGSAYFAEHPLVPLTNIAACVNFDMVGRLRENKLSLQGVGSSGQWRRWIEKRNVAAGFSLVLQDDPYLPTDVTSFYPRHIPVLNFFTGSHEDYHKASDDADKINYDGMERIVKFARGMLLDMERDPARPDYVKVEQSSSGGSRDNLRVYLGTIPDYASEVAGVKLSGVRGGSPAEKGGLKAGDIIVEFAGQKIANIYDYTYALDAAKIGKPLTVAVTRDGQKVSLTVTPEARK